MSLSKVINLFGAPGSGKSTVAMRLTSDLKVQGYNCELVTEYAKDLTWSKRHEDLRVQPYIFGKQLHKIERLIGKVDVIITDSPLLLSLIYTKEEWPLSFRQAVKDIFIKHNNYNFLLHRTWEYKSVGRNQTKKEADEIHEKIEKLLLDLKVHYIDLIPKENMTTSSIDEVSKTIRRTVFG
jgi:adenylate kinase family enzyme